MISFSEDMQLLDLELFDAAFAVTPEHEDDARRRFMTLFASTSHHLRGGSAQILKATNTLGETFAVKRMRTHTTSDSSSGSTPSPAPAAPHKELRHAIAGSPSPTPSGTPDYVTKGHVAAFYEEYRIHLALCNLRGFPKLYGFGLCQGDPLIVMEWVEGQTLRDALANRNAANPDSPLPLDTVAALGIAVLELLQRTRELDASFVHRDLSPRNIMLRTDRNPAAEQLRNANFDLCLIDFGSASLAYASQDPTFTQQSSVWRMGTPSYAPPEMLSADVALPEGYRSSPKIDVYALCSILYELYGGRVPFPAVSQAHGLSPYRTKTERSPLPLKPREPDGGMLAATIVSGLAPHQEDRPAPSELLAALQNWRQLPSQAAPARTRGSKGADAFWQPGQARRVISRRAFVSAGIVAASAVVSGALVARSLLGARPQVLDKSRYAKAATIYDGGPLFLAYDSQSKGWILATAGGDIAFMPTSSRPCGPLREGLCALFDDLSKRWGFVTPSSDAEGYAWWILPAFAQVGNFSQGLAAAQDPQTKLWGYIDNTGSWVIPARFRDACAFSGGAASVLDERTTRKSAGASHTESLLWGAIDPDGNWICEPCFATLGSRNDTGLAVAEDAAAPGTWGIVDAHGEWTCEPKFSQLRRMSSGLAPARDDARGLWGYVDATGEWVLPAIYRDARPFCEGLAAVQDAKSQLWYLIDSKGTPSAGMEPRFWKLGDLYDGLAPAQASLEDDTVVFDESDPDVSAEDVAMRYGYVDSTGAWQMRRLTDLVDTAIGPAEL